MDTHFIAWSGNQTLAKEVARLVESKTRDKAIVGGGRPEDLHIGSQVINQIQQCNRAILLVEDKGGDISPNLMFEWGYLIAKLPVNNIATFLINKSAKDLPSDLLGTWVYEIKVDRNSASDEEIAKEIFCKLQADLQTAKEVNYFDLINNWRQVFSKLSEKKPIASGDLCRYLIVGCLAAYYYMDYKALRHELNEMSVSAENTSVMVFAKAYIDVFIESNNIITPLSERNFFRLSQDFDMTLERRRSHEEEIDLLIDILCCGAYGIACSLFLRNEGLDQTTIDFCAKKALEVLEKERELLDKFESTHPNNKCLVLLIQAYINNDLGHLYKDTLNDKNKFVQYLGESVNARKKLYDTFVTYYNNSFLAIKFEQEYIIALSEQCVYMDESFKKTMIKNSIKNKAEEWERELLFADSLTERMKMNIKHF